MVCHDKMEGFTAASFVQAKMNRIKKTKQKQSHLEHSQNSSSNLHAWAKQS